MVGRGSLSGLSSSNLSSTKLLILIIAMNEVVSFHCQSKRFVLFDLLI